MTTKNKKKKTAREKRILVGAFLTAVVIAAGSTFAWFTSEDEVTNRLSANADYEVSIVESFTPPENWIPGSEINKDVYAVNTGNIAAFVKEEVSGKLTITTEQVVTTSIADTGIATLTDSNFADCVTLDEDEIYVMEAGSYLAYKPTASTNVVGNQIVAYPAGASATTEKKYRNNTTGNVLTKTEYEALTEGQENYTEIEIGAAKTDFTPASDGLYVFRRSIVVAGDRSEQFSYEGYYYKDGTYYKIKNLAVTPDTIPDIANDEGEDSKKDGNLASATASLVKDVTETVTPTLTYDAANNRLVATYARNTGSKANLLNAWNTAAATLDEKEHDLAAARAQLDRALLDKSTSDAAVQQWTATIAQLEAEIDAVQDRIDELETLIGNNSSGLTKEVNDLTTNVESEKTAAENAIGTLYGESNKTSYNNDGEITYTENSTDTSSTTDGKYKDLLKAKEDLEAAKTAYGDSMFAAYASELHTAFPSKVAENSTYDAAIAALTYTELTGNTAPSFDATSQAELHEINRLTVALAQAQYDYDTAKTDAESKLAQYISDKNRLGAAGTTNTAPKTETIGGQTITYNESTVTGGSGLAGQLAEYTAEQNTLNAKKTALNTALNTAYGEAVNAAKAGTETNTADANVTEATNAYNNAMSAYATALAGYNSAKNAYEGSGDLRIYINLSSDVGTTGGMAEKWQMLPVPASSDAAFTDNTAVFYYTSILEASEHSKKLIDSVALAEDVTQDMYKSFDFDLNVALKSAQISYDSDQETILATATTSELGKTATLSNPKDINTPLTWN